MIPPIYELLKASAPVTALLGNPKPRVYPFDQAPQTPTYPYATWQIITGSPENYLGQLPDMDSYGTQIDVWANDADSCIAVAKAIRDALEPSAYMTDYGNTERDADTFCFRYRMTFEFYKAR